MSTGSEANFPTPAQLVEAAQALPSTLKFPRGEENDIVYVVSVCLESWLTGAVQIAKEAEASNA